MAHQNVIGEKEKYANYINVHDFHNVCTAI